MDGVHVASCMVFRACELVLVSFKRKKKKALAPLLQRTTDDRLQTHPCFPLKTAPVR